MSAPVGFIGIGIMGLGMCHNLLRAGRSLVIWNRSVAASQALAAEELAKDKVTIAATPSDVMKQCDIVYSMLSTPEASAAVFPSILEGCAPGKHIIDCATLTPEDMIKMAEAVRAKGTKFLEAPVSGSKGPAEQGQLIFLTAGDAECKDAAEKDLEAMGKSTFYFGPEVGKGTRMKLVVNMIMGIQLNALAEGMALAENCDLSADDLVKILGLGAMNSPMMNLKGPMMANKNYGAQFPLKHAQKDIRFAIQLGDDLGLALPVASASNEQFKVARGKHGDDDFAAVVEASRGNATKKE